MKPWQPGDPVGCGEVYLPDKKTRAAYGEACRRMWIEAAANRVVGLPTIEARRKFIAGYPRANRELLKQIIKELWEKER